MTRKMFQVLGAVLLATAVALVAVPLSVSAQTPEEVLVKVGRTATVSLPRQPQILDIEDSTIAIVEVLPDGKARVTGKAVGTTRIVGRDHAQVPIIIRVKVLPG